MDWIVRGYVLQDYMYRHEDKFFLVLLYPSATTSLRKDGLDEYIRE